MLLRWWHKLWKHHWNELAFQIPSDPEGRRNPITQLIRRCDCGAVQSAQVIGNPIDVARLAAGDDPEVQALRRIANLDPGR